MFAAMSASICIYINISFQHDISQMRFIINEQVISFQTPLHLHQSLLTREARMALTKDYIWKTLSEPKCCCYGNY